jgi:hypothetical protein
MEKSHGAVEFRRTKKMGTQRSKTEIREPELGVVDREREWSETSAVEEEGFG